MSQLDQLGVIDSPSLNDQIALYSNDGGFVGRISLNALLQVLAQLPTVQPVAGSQELWIDTTAGNTVKVAL